MRAPVFSRCEGCLHQALTRGTACGLCGGALVEGTAPEDLFTGWRCDCYHCTATPC